PTSLNNCVNAVSPKKSSRGWKKRLICAKWPGLPHFRVFPKPTCMKKQSSSLMIWNMGRFNWMSVWLLLLPAFAAAAEHPDSLFAKGNRLYAAGDYEGAATCYETLVTDGYQEAAVYYN